MPTDNVHPEAPPSSESQLDLEPAGEGAGSNEPGAAEAEDSSGSRRFLLATLVSAAIVLLFGVVYLVDWLATKDEIAKGTRIGSVDVGGLTSTEAVGRLEAELAALNAPLSMQAHDTAVTIDPAAAGLTTDFAGSVAAAGTRTANPFSRIGAVFGASEDLPVITTVDQPRLAAELTAVAVSTDVPAVEGQLSISGTTVTAVQPVSGQQLDVPGAASAITAAWTSGDPRSVETVTLPVSVQPVRVNQDQLTKASAEASAVLSGPLTVQAGENSIVIPLETVSAAVTVAPDAADGFDVTVDESALRAAYRPQVEASQTAPTDASIAIVDDAPVLRPGVDGRSVNWPATDGALGAALRSADHVLNVVYTLTPPSVSTESLQTLGIKEVVAEFTTGGFATDSGQNVKRTAEEVQGAIVLPGETFSLNGYTGPRGAAEGYIEAGIINNGLPGRAIGGGISQFATTLFNASYFAGMEDVEHKAHSFYISRYPPGREATVFEAEDGSSIIDVKFRNVYSTAILIQTIWTPDDITVKFWGSKTVDVESIAGDRYGFTGPPTQTIPYGQTCRATNGSDGFSIDVTRVIRDLAGRELSRETKTTTYNGQVRVSCAPPPVVETPPAEAAPPPGE